MSIALCMIVKNEEKFLDRCLNSVKSIVDEIIIVDTGSIDATKKIAKKHEATIIHYKWQDDFAAARNESIKHAKSDWILVLDADETIAEQDCQKISELIEKVQTKKETMDGTTKEIMKETAEKNTIPSEVPVGFSFKQRTYTYTPVTDMISAKDDPYEESKGFIGWKQSSIVRLFTNDKQIKFKNRVHELIEESLLKAGGRIEVTKIPIHHFTALKPARFQLEKKQKYHEMILKKIEEHPDEPKPYLEIGLEYLASGQSDKAILAFEKVEKLAPWYAAASSYLAEIFYMQKQYQKAFEKAKKALTTDPNDIKANDVIAKLFLMKGMLDPALRALKKVIMKNPRRADALLNIGAILDRKKKHKLAFAYYKKAIALGFPLTERLAGRIKRLERMFSKQE